MPQLDVKGVDPGPRSPMRLWNKVPEITLFFWLIKVLATTVGETAADFLAEHLNLGLTNTTYVMSVLFIAALIWQFRTRRYVPGVYWLVVVLISIVGTLFSDNLVDNLGVSLWTTTIGFSILLAGIFVVWYRSERTLSIHTIFTFRREAFYWLAILFTFALGTSGGDLVAEKLNVGYGPSIVLFAAAIAVVAIAHFRFHADAVLTFWIAYILTRPLGASMGDFLSQKQSAGGLGLGSTTTSLLFVATIMGVVVYLAISKRDQPPAPQSTEEAIAGT